MMRADSLSTRCALALAACVGSSDAAHLQSPAPLFARAVSVPVGAGPGQILLDDLNQDGRVDMVTRHLLQKQIGVFLGDGRGGFAPSSAGSIAVDYQPGGIAIADVNGDSTNDLVAAKSERDAVDVFLGDGTGAFTRATGSPFSAGGSREFYTRAVHLVDVNEDRRLDIVMANGRENTFAILFGDGRGSFTLGPVVKRDVTSQRQAFAFGDIDGDGHLDAVVVSRTDDATPGPGRVAVLRGDGRGAFTDAAPITVARNPHFVTLAHANGDRRLDLIVSHSESSIVSVLLNDGAGRFVPAPDGSADFRSEAFMVAVADVDGDGRPDLLGATGESAVVLAGDGRGRFAAAPGSPFRAGPGAYQVAVADINGDGKVDLAASSFEGDAVTVWLGR